ncbi:hypothetical protein CSC16_3703 [Proteus mirabilis]|nr:hypothetical protein CSC16_3703 [Proteus mirabilis]
MFPLFHLGGSACSWMDICEYGSVTKTIQESGLFAACREPFALSSVR